MVTNYQKGYSAENKCVNELKAEGYIAMRTAGSHGPADVVAVNTEHVMFIQVKTIEDIKDVAKARKQAIEEIMKIPLLWRDNSNEEWNKIMYREVWVKVRGQRGWATKEYV